MDNDEGVTSHESSSKDHTDIHAGEISEPEVGNTEASGSGNIIPAEEGKFRPDNFSEPLL